jgi:hypothetical protein
VAAGKAYVILDGSLLRIDRVGAVTVRALAVPPSLATWAM